ncbi:MULTISPECIES: PQQ-binding-like beta-propeller repeat protein [unclassified Streptomyces]|uniref:outer membrane protein assembly factor BamB family protein n=1 Tax=unclassified Streptomyces TaxID=2593676 RepID=UPI0036E9D43B
MKRIRKRRLRQVRPVWQVPGAPGRTHDAVGDWRTARLVIRGRPDGLHGYDLETGEPRWSWIAPDHRLLLAMSRTAVGGVGLAVHADENGPGEWPATCTVTAFSTDDGNVLWSVPYDFSNEPWTYDYDRFAGAIALAPDRAVVLTQGRPAAHALSSGNTVWPPIAPLKGDSRLAVCGHGIVQIGLADGDVTVRCLDASEGSIRWETRPDTGGPVREVQVLLEDPLAILCLGKGRRGVEMLLVLDSKDGRPTARIPVHGPHGELRVQSTYGLLDDQPVAAVGDLLVAMVRPPGTYGDHLTAFTLDRGTPRWTWRSEGTISGVFASGDSVVAVSKWESSEGPDGTVHVHQLNGATGVVRAVRRLRGYQAGMRGRYHLDGDRRLVRVSHWGEGAWHPAQMFRLR